jgi:hypothetical protein
MLLTKPRPPLLADPIAAADLLALDFVTTEGRLIRAMIFEFLGRGGEGEVDDVVQDLWLHLRSRLRRRPRCRTRVALTAMTRNFLRNRRREQQALKRRPPGVYSLSWPLPNAEGEALEHVISVDICRGDRPSPEQAADWRFDVEHRAAKLPAHHRSFFERLRTMSVPEAARASRVARSTGYRWRRSIGERFESLFTRKS